MGSGHFVSCVQHIEGVRYDIVELVVGGKSVAADNFSSLDFNVDDVGIECCDTGVREQDEEKLKQSLIVMSTRSNIVIKVDPKDYNKVMKTPWGSDVEVYISEDELKSGKELYLCTYCHYDGYPSDAGEKLKKYFRYIDYDYVKEYVMEGSRSSVRESMYDAEIPNPIEPEVYAVRNVTEIDGFVDTEYMYEIMYEDSAVTGIGAYERDRYDEWIPVEGWDSGFEE